MEMTVGFFAASFFNACRISSLAVALPPGELIRTKTPFTRSSFANCSILATVGPAAIESPPPAPTMEPLRWSTTIVLSGTELLDSFPAIS